MNHTTSVMRVMLTFTPVAVAAMWAKMPLVLTGMSSKPAYATPSAAAETPATNVFHTPTRAFVRSEEHTSELQSQSNLVCRLLLEKKLDHIAHPVAQHCLPSLQHPFHALSPL